MKTIIITRHSGAVEWLRQEANVGSDVPDIEGAETVAHLAAIPSEPTVVVGTLPVHLAAAVCAAGGQYWHLELDVPPELRGAELTAQQMRGECRARVARYGVALWRAPIDPVVQAAADRIAASEAAWAAKSPQEQARLRAESERDAVEREYARPIGGTPV